MTTPPPRPALRYPENRSGLRCSSDSPTAAVIPQCLHLPPAAALRDSALRYPENRSGLRCSSDSPTAAVIPQCLHLPPAAALRDSALRTSAQLKKKTYAVRQRTVHCLLYNIFRLTDGNHHRLAPYDFWDNIRSRMTPASPSRQIDCFSICFGQKASL